MASTTLKSKLVMRSAVLPQHEALLQLNLNDTPVSSPKVAPEDEMVDGVGEIPLFFDKYSSFMSSNSPDEIIKALQTTLRSMRCDIRTCDPSKYMLYASFFHNCSSVDVNISIFRERTRKEDSYLLSPIPTRHLVEVQRRSGDAILFSQFYRKMLRKLRRQNKDMVDGYATPSIALSPLHPGGSPRDRPDQEVKASENLPFNDIVWTDDALRAIVDMMKSKFIETQREAILSLARGCCMATARSKICSEDFKEEVEPILKEMLHSKDRYIARCAVICVEHLCVSIECRDGCQAYVDDLFEVVRTWESDEIRRHGLHAIQLLSTSHEHCFTAKNKEHLRKFLRTFQDDEMRDFVKLTLNILEPTMILSPTASSPKVVPPIQLPSED